MFVSLFENKNYAVMVMRGFLSVLLGALPLLVVAGDPFDVSRADADGPHVFYRGPNVVVKSVQRRDTATVVVTDVYPDRKVARLTCMLPDLGDQFTFPLQTQLNTAPEIYPEPERMLVISDIEGNFEAFKMLLLSAGVINDQFQWIFGNGHLVLLGDYFDRGLNVTECLWLAYKLEPEALAAGGRLHFILGNHEVLNLQGDTRYVRNKYLDNARLIGEDYTRWYAEDTELGRWLRTKNAVERIGSQVFCHGGISPELAKTGLALTDINRIARKYLGYEHAAINDPFAKEIFSRQTGIFWYRGAAKGLMTSEEMTDVLIFAGARRMIVGHTLAPDITAMYGGRLITIDLYHDENLRMGFAKGLWFEKGTAYGFDSRGFKFSIFTTTYSDKQD
ncbi:MAG: metallophosphoesterase [Saprospiraceae bacterium]|nr:metallophosphoesterase [Saprospiraceae bacterium]